ncbi:hypothetical protein [Aquimarina muelleri]|uniref:Viral A-type inclusion protein n=1 Tax=Aquimarina muelleri TaxID=279356 RepID=A0A918JY83_9FLAO|nr:hypothetical protein [Aquimarina muelleri]MCX2764149.1 hypothetical protein [Aquimarina muelleri]GGX31488.1 hypothetical protein GCM10007384_35620 [Aquimarina muelleri]
MKLSFLYTSLLLLFISCNQLSKEEQEFDLLMQNVIDVHDEVMPKMGEMSSLIKELEAKIDTTSQGQSYAKAQQDIKDAYDYMMTWMSNFSDTFPPTDKDVTIASDEMAKQVKLLKEEEIKVNTLRDKINSSIKKAKDLLQKS